MDYSDYISYCEEMISYSEYFAEQIDRNINYNEYLTSVIKDKKVNNRINKIKNLFKI